MNDLENWFKNLGEFESEVEYLSTEDSGYSPDARVKLWSSDFKIELMVEVRVTIVPRNIEALKRKMNTHGVDLFAAEYITPEAKQRLRKSGIGYLDRRGNAYIRKDGVYLHFDFEKKTIDCESLKKKSKAFSKQGLRLIYFMLMNYDLLNQPYREVERTTGISRTTVERIISALNEEGYMDSGGGQIFFTNKRALLEDWLAEYKKLVRRGGNIDENNEALSKIQQLLKSIQDEK